MAYNPFNIFRRNQKVIFAVLTVFIMFMFTLSSGVVGGDFFETFSQWLGSKGKRGEWVCTIDGTKVYERDLQQLNTSRRMANQYMSLLALTTVAQLDDIAKDLLPRLSPVAQQGFMRQVMQDEGVIEMARRDPKMAMQLEQFGMSPERSLQRMRVTLSQALESPAASAEDKEYARAKLAKVILLENLRTGGHYFVAAPNRSRRDQIDFMLWQKKADQLGIKFTTDDVQRLVRRELFGFLNDEVQKDVQKVLARDMRNFTVSACLRAVGEEFRVRAAQVAVLGPDVHGGRGDKTYGGFPMFNPPYEAFEFYRDACSPTSYAAIPVPAANLLPEVDRRLALPSGDPARIAEPTESELRALFDKYKDVMYSPDKETPGFKIPPRVRLEWFQVTGEEPYYKAEAEKALRNELLQSNLWAVMSAQGHGPAAGLVALGARPFVHDPLLTRRYAELVEKHNQTQARRYMTPEVDFLAGVLGMPLLESSVVRPGNLAVAAGGMGGQLAGLGNPLAGLAVTVGGPMAYEIRDRVRVGMPAVLGMLSPAAGQFNTAVGGAAAYHTMLPRPLPIDVYRGEFMQTMIAEKAKDIAFVDNGKRVGDRRAGGDVDEFIAEVKKLSEDGRAKDMTAAQKYIAEFLAHLPHASEYAAVVGQPAVSAELARRQPPFAVSTQKTPRTEYELEDDPDLAPLVAAQKESLQDPGSPHRGSYTPFGRGFFWDVDPFQGGTRPISGRYVPRQYPPAGRLGDTSKTKFVVWRVEEISATPRAWNDATKAVVKEAWKHAKARDLAKEKADALAGAIREQVKAIEAGGKGKADEINLVPYLRDEAEKLRAAAPADAKAQRRAQPFPVRGVSPLTSLPGNPAAETGLPSFGPFDLPALPGPVQGFLLLPSENIKYPSVEFQTSLLDERTKPPGTVLVLPDQPKDTYYVLTLVKRDEKRETDFLTQVAGGRLSDQYGGPTIMAAFHREASRKTILSIHGLLRQEFRYDETDEQKKKLDENERHGGNEG